MTNDAIVGLAGVLVWTDAERFPAMARFYRDTLGLTPRSSKSDFINFDWNGVRLSVGVHDRVHGAQPGSAPRDDSPHRERHPRRTRLDWPGPAWCSQREPEQEEWGGWVATFADPDGNTLQLMQLPTNRP